MDNVYIKSSKFAELNCMCGVEMSLNLLKMH